MTPKPDQSLHFFVDVLGMTETARQGESVYLRAWDDYEHHTLKLTAAKTSGMGHMAFRARSPQALDRRVAALKDSGHDIGWTEGGVAKSQLISIPAGSSVITTSLAGVQADANTDVVITNVSSSTAGLTGRLRVNQAVVAVLQ